MYNPITPGEGNQWLQIGSPGCLTRSAEPVVRGGNPNCGPGKKAEVKTRGLCRSLSRKTGQTDRWQEDEGMRQRAASEADWGSCKPFSPEALAPAGMRPPFHMCLLCGEGKG